jgi:hypothetical protein
MSEAIRTERKFGVTAELRPIQQMHLLSLLNSEVWPDLLDVMEMVCIEQETRLINTDAAKEAEVLAEHKMSKAAWMIFTHLQEKVQQQARLYLSSVTKQSIAPALTREEELIENILDPTRGLTGSGEEGMLGETL